MLIAVVTASETARRGPEPGPLFISMDFSVRTRMGVVVESANTMEPIKREHCVTAAIIRIKLQGFKVETPATVRRFFLLTSRLTRALEKGQVARQNTNCCCGRTPTSIELITFSRMLRSRDGTRSVANDHQATMPVTQPARNCGGVCSWPVGEVVK